MKRIGATLMIFLILSNMLEVVAVYGLFKINQKYIEAELCENRNIPDSDCHGGCILKKNMEETNQPEASLPEMKLMAFTLSNRENVEVFYSLKMQKTTTINQPVETEYLNTIFKPPKCS
ncbi:MAG: hypothetical protein H6607_10845 [Flavobacteriales bacterium]|nr:hypothetical protein [Flavobacteriales bacterium]